jgi:hypothetical protein
MDRKKTFTESVFDIEEQAQGNLNIKSLLLDDFYRNIPYNINIKNKSILNDLFFSSIRNGTWECGHNGCRAPSCFSHEISENVFLNRISNVKSKVYILKRDMKENPLFYREDETHKRNASNFLGYCSYHDQRLFRDIEKGSQELNAYFINNQCLRTVRREQFEINVKIKAARVFLDSIEDQLLVEDDVQAVVNHLNDKINALKVKLIRANEIYEQIYCGINSGNYIIEYKSFELNKSGYFFSAMLDCTLDNDCDFCVSFLYKLDFDNGPVAIICTLNNELSMGFADEIVNEYENYFVDAIFLKKERLILSERFVTGLDQTFKSAIYRDPEFYKIGVAEMAMMLNEFF